MFRVAIVGRPNVGKSTLFNRLARRRKALVGDEPGITRDRIFHVVRLGNRAFELIDTGGIVPDESDELHAKVLAQAEAAILGADLVWFMVDARSGMIPLDEEVARRLREYGRRFWVLANKVDGNRLQSLSWDFTRLGAERLFPMSAEHGTGVDELIEALEGELPGGVTVPEPGQVEISLAVVGRPNVGKSSIVNRLLGEERVIVSEVPGTTVDAVDSVLEDEGVRYRIVDTAGIRRKGKTTGAVAKGGTAMARRHIRRADVVVLVLDATDGVTHLDAVIGGYAHEEGRSVVIAVNKWDLVTKNEYTMHQVEREYRRQLRFLDYAPMLFVSAKTGQRLNRLLRTVREAHEGGGRRVPTPELNQFIQGEVAPILMRDSKRKFPLKYICQIGTNPPTFVVFLRGGEKLHFSTVRFLVNRLREHYGFYASPVRLIQRTARKASSP